MVNTQKMILFTILPLNTIIFFTYLKYMVFLQIIYYAILIVEALITTIFLEKQVFQNKA